MNITVTLRPGYLARHVTLCVAKSTMLNPRARRWRIYGRDSGDCLFPATVDGEQPGFATQRDAFAYLGTLRGSGVPARIWAEPRDRRLSTYVAPSAGRGFDVIEARA